MLAAAVASGSTSTTPTVKLGAGTFKLNLTALDRIYLEGLSSDLTTIIPASPTSPIISAGGAAGLADQRSTINKVRITSGGADRQYQYPLIKFTASRNVIFGDDVFFDVAGFTCLCVELASAYQLRWHGVQFRTGSWAVPVWFSNPNNVQCDTSLFDMQVDGTIGGIFRTTVNDIHGFDFRAKVVQTSYYATAPAENTSLSGAHSATATSLTVASGTGIVANDVLVIDPGLDVCEPVRVLSVAGTAVTLHSSTPLRFAHATAAEVFRGGVPFSFADGYHNVSFYGTHFEGQQIGVAAGNVHGLHFYAPYKGVGRLIHVWGDTTQVRVISPEMMGTVNKNELLRRASNTTASGDGQWYCEDPRVPAGASITPTIFADYFPHNTRVWRLVAASAPGNGLVEYFNVPSAGAGNKRFLGLQAGSEKLNVTYGSGTALQGRLATAVSITLNATDPEYIAVTDTTAARTITLPAASACVPGKTFRIVDESNAAGTNNITVTRAGSDTILNGTTATTAVVSTNAGNRAVYVDGTSKWTVV